jgi:hypothetical protein
MGKRADRRHLDTTCHMGKRADRSLTSFNRSLTSFNILEHELNII